MLLLAGFGYSQQGPRAFSEARSLPDLIMPVSFAFSKDASQYSISVSGKGSRTGGESRRAFDLQLQKDERLARTLYFAQYQSDLVLVCEVTDGDNGSGFIARLDGSTLRMKWKQGFAAFNVGQGLLDGDYAYITGIGFIAKVNLQSGAFMWGHQNLYRPGSGEFNSFDLPEVSGNVVIFRESLDYLPKKKAVIRVERESGKIMSIGT